MTARWEQRWPIANRPRENVTLARGRRFCRWLTAPGTAAPRPAARPGLVARLDAGWSIRLPTEAEWVKAAAGTTAATRGRAGVRVRPPNVDESKQGGGQHNLQEPTAGMYPHGASPFGVEEMSGNVWEYCLNKYDNLDDLTLGGDDRRAGGSWFYNPSGRPWRPGRRRRRLDDSAARLPGGGGVPITRRSATLISALWF